MLKKLKTLPIILLLLIGLFYTLLNPSAIFKDILEALNVFINNLFPAMFFFYTLSDLLINYGFINILEYLFNGLFKKVFHISGASSFIVIMSILSGFPSGAKYTTTFLEKKLIEKDQANYLLTFTHFSNPLFILGTISIIYGKNLALIVLISHYIANFVLAFIIRPKKLIVEKYKSNIQKNSFSTTLATSFYNSSKILLLVLGNTIFFFTASSILTVNIDNNLIKSMLMGLFDLTKGILSLQNLNISNMFKIILITSFLSFGGISVHFQVKEIIKKERLNYMYFLLGRISSLAISIIIALICGFAIGII